MLNEDVADKDVTGTRSHLETELVVDPTGSTISPLRTSQLLALPVYLRCASEFVCILDNCDQPGPWCRYELQHFSTVRKKQLC